MNLPRDLTEVERYELEKDDEFVTGVESFLFEDLELRYIMTSKGRLLAFVHKGRGVTRLASSEWAAGWISLDVRSENTVKFDSPLVLLENEKKAAEYLSGVN